MKSANYWGGVILDPGSEFTSFDTIAAAIQTDAAAHFENVGRVKGRIEGLREAALVCIRMDTYDTKKASRPINNIADRLEAELKEGKKDAEPVGQDPATAIAYQLYPSSARPVNPGGGLNEAATI